MATDRAKQFMPFDALTGLRAALEQREKIVVPKIELSEESKEELDRRMKLVAKNSIISVVYFNGRGTEGEYLKVTGMVSKIDENSRYIKIVNKSISFDDIYAIELE